MESHCEACNITTGLCNKCPIGSVPSGHGCNITSEEVLSTATTITGHMITIFAAAAIIIAIAMFA